MLALKVGERKKKCFQCGCKHTASAMHLAKIKIKTRPWLIWLVLRNFMRLLLGHKPEHVSKKSWLFGNYQRVEKKRVARWFCFECYIAMLTPTEFAAFRSAYYDEVASASGDARAAELVARLDSIFSGQAETGNG